MPFVKGQSGNPGGRGVRAKDGRTLAQIAREHTEEAIETLVDVMRNGDSDSARVTASTQILNRGWGQAPQTISIETPEAALDMTDFSEEQLEAIETLRSIGAITSGTAGIC